MSVTCAIEACGIDAFGRCKTCGNAFCRSHAGRSEYSLKIDQCSLCQGEESREREIATGWLHRRFFEAEAARRLMASGVPMVPRTQTFVTTRIIPGGLFRKDKAVTELETRTVGKGWRMGLIETESYRSATSADDNAVDKERREVLMDAWAADGYPIQLSAQPTMDGWKALVGRLLELTGTTWDPHTWKEPKY